MNNNYPVGSLNLDNRIVEILKKNNIIYFSEIQRQSITKLLNNKSILGLSQTGTGKTFSFVLPIINYLLKNDNNYVQSIIITPTNFLLEQIKKVIYLFISELNLKQDKVKCIKSNNDLKDISNSNIILTTPALINSCFKRININQINYLIIDEGDMIIFDGFNDIIQNINLLIKKQVVSIFSASINIQDISRIKSTFKINNVIDVRDKAINTSCISHHIIAYRGISQIDALKKFILLHNINKSIIFVSSKKELFYLKNEFKLNNSQVYFLHGDLSKSEIKSILNNFNKNDDAFLITTDLSSRGVDLENIENIISYSLPIDLTYYFHRAGRSGRFFSVGNSFILFDESKNKNQINDLIRRGVKFDIYILNKDNNKKANDTYLFKNLGKKDQSNAILQKQIRHAINKTKSKKVKPNYKKKVLKAVKRVKEKHRKKIILTNISKSGGNTRDFHD